MMIFLSLTFQPLQSDAATSSKVVSTSANGKTLMLRLNEIKMMEKSNLKASDRKQLRNEVRSIREQLKTADGGIYLSVGAIIIILLLLILLF